mmetsp:Transcript_23053/g.50299  ORF Transcript_23053/g.50299 Transcript_23053/m.50299 type:complete len:91 (-) Transcript_23053:2378-2650(-)
MSELPMRTGPREKPRKKQKKLELAMKSAEPCKCGCQVCKQRQEKLEEQVLSLQRQLDELIVENSSDDDAADCPIADPQQPPTKQEDASKV